MPLCFESRAQEGVATPPRNSVELSHRMPESFSKDRFPAQMGYGCGGRLRGESMIRNICKLVVGGALLLVGMLTAVNRVCAEDSPGLKLEKGENIVLIGSRLPERRQNNAWL